MTISFTQVTGSVDHSNELTTRRPLDMSDLITRADGDNTPFVMFSQTLDFAPCSQEKFEWQERGDEDLFVTVNGAVADGVTTVVVDTPMGNRVLKNDILGNRTTGEKMLVTSVTSATQFEVHRNLNALTTPAIADNEVLYIESSAMEEGSSSRDVTGLQPGTNYNYIQTSRDGYKVSGRVQNVGHYGEDPLSFAREDKLRSFLRKLERKYLTGTRSKTTIAAMGDVTTSGGLQFFMDNESGCVQSDQSSVATWTRADFNAMMKDALAIGSDHKIAICGWDVLNVLGDFAWDKLNINDMAVKSLGITIKRYESDYGIIDFMPHKLFTAADNRGGLGLDGEMWIFDPANIKRRGLPSRSEITLFTGPSGDQLQGVDEDATHQEFWVEDGLEVRHAETMYRAYGITA